MKPWAWLLVAAVGLAAVAAWLLWPAGNGGGPAPPGGLAGKAVTDDGAGGVTVTATRQATAAGDATLTFDVKLDTHTVDLTNYDITAHSHLEDAKGTRIAPGAGSAETVPGSHHKEARLVFDRPADGRMVLVVEGLGGVPERRLVFE